MNRDRLKVGLAVLALAAFAACGDAEQEAPDAVLVDTLTQPGTATVQVPVTDTAIVQQEIMIDTTISTDTTIREGEVTDTIGRP